MHLIKVKIFSILLVTGCFSFSATAQSVDANLLKSINPQNPNSAVWKTISSSGYPLALATPLAIWVDGSLEHNNKTKFKAYTIMGGIVIASAGTVVIKKIINRPRPFQTHDDVYPYRTEYGESLPSGHATVAFAAATGLALHYKKWYVVVPAYVWASGVCYSRVYLGEHYPTDVLAGAAMGTGSAILSYWLSHKIFKHGRSHK